jgi:hypothetical protein
MWGLNKKPGLYEYIETHIDDLLVICPPNTYDIIIVKKNEIFTLKNPEKLNFATKIQTLPCEYK